MRHTQCYLPGYPRPQFVREAWQDLCGEWDLCFDDADAGERLGWQRGFAPTHTITVPFVYSCEASGIGDVEPGNSTLWIMVSVRDWQPLEQDDVDLQ